MRVSSLPNAVTWKRNGRNSNPRPFGSRANALPFSHTGHWHAVRVVNKSMTRKDPNFTSVLTVRCQDDWLCCQPGWNWIDLFVVARQIRFRVPGERSVSRAGAERWSCAGVRENTVERQTDEHSHARFRRRHVGYSMNAYLMTPACYETAPCINRNTRRRFLHTSTPKMSV